MFQALFIDSYMIPTGSSDQVSHLYSYSQARTWRFYLYLQPLSTGCWGTGALTFVLMLVMIILPCIWEIVWYEFVWYEFVWYELVWYEIVCDMNLCDMNLGTCVIRLCRHFDLILHTHIRISQNNTKLKISWITENLLLYNIYISLEMLD